ncbi:MAG: hypothetical protein HC845_03190 [Akkermansiaceae bacterium]|nr:hypothetical protein [Akkermansiaceae bacterium]
MPKVRDPDEPRIYFLPNLMTACNLACGFFAVLMIFKGMVEVGNQKLSPKEYYEILTSYYQYAILLIFGSCLFDLLDGRLARLGGQESPFGQQFDSLADIISFGMAPAMLLSRACFFHWAISAGSSLSFTWSAERCDWRVSIASQHCRKSQMHRLIFAAYPSRWLLVSSLRSLTC